MTTYATLDDIKARYPRELAQLAADDKTGVRDDVRINAVLGDVTVQITGILLARYRRDELARLDSDSRALLLSYAIPDVALRCRAVLLPVERPREGSCRSRGRRPARDREGWGRPDVRSRSERPAAPNRARRDGRQQHGRADREQRAPVHPQSHPGALMGDGVSFTYDETALEGALKAVGELVTFNGADLMESIAILGESQTRRRISDEKTAPDGTPWKPNAEGTSILQRTGQNLLASVAFTFSADEAVVGRSLGICPHPPGWRRHHPEDGRAAAVPGEGQEGGGEERHHPGPALHWPVDGEPCGNPGLGDGLLRPARARWCTMSVAPAPLSELLAGTRLALTRDAVEATLARLLPGVAVVALPGKLDINDYVQKAIVDAPGVAVGYTRLRQVGDPGGTWSDVVDFAAYIVVDDWVDFDVDPPKTNNRELVGHAIGGQILRALRDPVLCFWGLTEVEPPSQDPPPALVPVFTSKVEENMTAIYAVTWSQALANDGTSFFGGPPASASTDEDFPDSAGLIFETGDVPYDDLPPELQAHLNRARDGSGT